MLMLRLKKENKIINSCLKKDVLYIIYFNFKTNWTCFFANHLYIIIFSLNDINLKSSLYIFAWFIWVIRCIIFFNGNNNFNLGSDEYIFHLSLNKENLTLFVIEKCVKVSKWFYRDIDCFSWDRKILQYKYDEKKKLND